MEKKISDKLSRLILETQELIKKNPGLINQLDPKQLPSFKELSKEDIDSIIMELKKIE